MRPKAIQPPRSALRGRRAVCCEFRARGLALAGVTSAQLETTIVFGSARLTTPRLPKHLPGATGMGDNRGPFRAPVAGSKCRLGKSEGRADAVVVGGESYRWLWARDGGAAAGGSRKLIVRKGADGFAVEMEAAFLLHGIVLGCESGSGHFLVQEKSRKKRRIGCCRLPGGAL